MIKQYFKEQLDKGMIIYTPLKGKSIYSKYQIGDKICFLMIQSIDDNGINNKTMKTIVERDLKKFEEEYNYIDTILEYPVFELKRDIKND